MFLELEHEHKHETQELPPTIKKQIPQKTLPHSLIQSTPAPPPSFPNLTSSTDFSSPTLLSLLQPSVKPLTSAVSSLILKALNFHESRIYTAVLQENSQFVAVHLVGSNAMKQVLNEMMEEIHGQIEAGVWDGRYEIKNKSHFSLQQKQDRLVVQIAEDLLKKNLSSLKQDMDPFSPEAYSPDNPATKAAEQFIKKMKAQQQIKRQSKIRAQQQRKQKEAKKAEAEKQEFEQAKQQKRIQIEKRRKQQQQFMQKQRQKREQIHKNYLSLVSNYKKPLYKQRQEQYRRQLVSQHRQHLSLLQEWHDDHRSIPREEILEHIQRYNQIKEEKEYARDEAIQMKEKEMMLRKAGQKYYKGKIYRQIQIERLEKEEEMVDSRQISMDKIKRQEEYSEMIKKNYAPKIDIKKAQQMEDLIKKMRSKTIDHAPNKHSEQGKRNLQKLHKMVNDLRARGKLKQSLDENQLATPIKKYQNYLHQMRSSSSTSSSPSTLPSPISLSALIPQSLQQMRLLAKLREGRAKKKQVYIESSLGTMGIEDHMRGRKQVQEQYLESIRVKAEMIKRLNK